ncbi:DUF58 domain-containing protein [Clostridium bornimense]|uniref:DUF58 domain-containing protein n=1 Tax=Clostridium bornimense TaxID=1216932 RepID=UPI001C1094FA|nr:DUF58 domain-containing protein [Clostridium bornimense]MBU5315779.1 DUF58 domain-containing protein [Clostridium bornimense]
MKENIFDKDFFTKLNKINMALNFRLSNGTQGGRKSKAKGVSVEFSDFREYAPGDDFRRIDWNAYGRLDKLFVKVFMEEREGVFNFFLDKSKSMDQGDDNKGEMALKIVASLGYITINNLDRIIVSGLEDGNIVDLGSGTGKRTFQKLLRDLNNIEFNGATNLGESIRKRKITGRGVSIVISDFLNNGGLENLEEGLKYLAFKKQQIILVQVLSKEDMEPNIDEEVTLIDSETREEVKMTLNYKVIEEYKKALKTYNNNLKNMAKKYGAKIVFVRSDESLEKVILDKFTRNNVVV